MVRTVTRTRGTSDTRNNEGKPPVNGNEEKWEVGQGFMYDKTCASPGIRSASKRCVLIWSEMPLETSMECSNQEGGAEKSRISLYGINIAGCPELVLITL